MLQRLNPKLAQAALKQYSRSWPRGIRRNAEFEKPVFTAVVASRLFPCLRPTKSDLRFEFVFCHDFAFHHSWSLQTIGHRRTIRTTSPRDRTSEDVDTGAYRLIRSVITQRRNCGTRLLTVVVWLCEMWCLCWRFWDLCRGVGENSARWTDSVDSWFLLKVTAPTD